MSDPKPRHATLIGRLAADVKAIGLALEEAEAKLAEAEAGAAAMREVLAGAAHIIAYEHICDGCSTWGNSPSAHQRGCKYMIALTSSAGRALLERMERAERERDEAQAELDAAWKAADCPVRGFGVPLAEVIPEKMRRARRDAMEEAAELCENIGAPITGYSNRLNDEAILMCEAARDCATAIRARIDSSGAGDAAGAERAAYNHSRGDSVLTPCPECAALQTPEERERAAREATTGRAHAEGFIDGLDWARNLVSTAACSDEHCQNAMQIVSSMLGAQMDARRHRMNRETPPASARG